VEATTDDAQRQRELRRQGIADAKARATEKNCGETGVPPVTKMGFKLPLFRTVFETETLLRHKLLHSSSCRQNVS